MLLENVTIGFGITASYCTHNSVLPYIKILIKEGAQVIPVMTYNSYNVDTRFGTAKDFIEQVETMCKRKIITTIVDAEPIGPKNTLDLMLVAPCTGNTLGKIANGITDTSVTMACKAQLRNLKPVLLAISTNDGLSMNAKNLGMLLNSRNIYFVPFGQDDPIKKCNSLIAKMDMLLPSIQNALKGRQIQPILI